MVCAGLEETQRVRLTPSKNAQKTAPGGGMHVAHMLLTCSRCAVVATSAAIGRIVMNHPLLDLRHVLVLVAAALLSASCGSEGGTAQLAEELFGTWDLISLEADGMTTDCPGEIMLGDEESVSCATQYLTLSANGTFIEIETTDELGNPFNYRYEGTWATSGNTLTLTYLREGPDENNLDPISPPETESGSWSLSGTTLTVSIPTPVPPFITVSATLEKR